MVDSIEVGIIGTGWCGGIRAVSCADNPLVSALHLAEVNAERLKEVADLTSPATATGDYAELLANDAIAAIIISATPETTHYPMAKACLEVGKHVFLEKPIAMTLAEADELLAIAKRNGVKFTIGYSQRFNPKFAYIRKSLNEGAIGKPVSALISRHLTRGLGDKISARVKLSPAAMEATHDLDFALWCLAPAKPVRVYSQAAYGAMKDKTGAADTQYIICTLDNGVVVNIGAGWVMPPGYPNYSGTWIEFIGTDGMLMVDDTHRDVIWNTMANGIQLPMSSMPGEPVDHVYAGPMAVETEKFVDAVARDRPVLVTGEEARQVMEVYIAADISAERGEPVTLPLNSTDLPSEAAAE